MSKQNRLIVCLNVTHSVIIIQDITASVMLSKSKVTDNSLFPDINQLI